MAHPRPWRPRHLVHRGIVRAAAVLVDARPPGADQARARVLRLWKRGVRVHRLEEGWLVRLHEPAAMDAARAPGAVFVQDGDALVAFPIPARDREKARVPPGAVARFAAGVLDVRFLSDSSLISPADWLDVQALEEVEVRSLGAPPPAARTVFAPAPPFAAREKFSGVPAAAPEREAVMRALEERAGRGTRPGRAGWWTSLLARLSRRSPRAGEGTRAPSAMSSPGWLTRLFDVAHRAFVRLLMLAQLGSRLGRRQAEYLARMIEMLESGDVENGLKHAIPVDGPEGERIRLALAPPRPRADLRLRAGATAAGSVIPMGDDLLDRLRQLYRATFDRLADQGRIEEAAFVLAELLHSNEEAVSFLERHGRLQLAAEMAEARELAPGLVVRQWFVAGRRGRAVEIARRRGAFLDAIFRLERSPHGDDALALRLLWADALASEGDYAGAVEAAWPVPAARRLAAEWIARVIEQGGPAGAAMLLRKLDADPAAFADVRARSLALLSAEDAEGVASRLAFAEALVKAQARPERAALARPAVRAVLRDAALFGTRLTPELLRKLADAAGDGALRTDLPPMWAPARAPLERWPTAPVFAVQAHDVGTARIHDACLLPGGQMLAALGEAGVVMRGRDGRAVAHFDAPADHLVLADAGDRAIALAQRGSAWRLVRLDLVRRTTQEWCDARIHSFAATYDGARWFVADSGGLWAIDAFGAGFDGPWRVPDLNVRNVIGANIARSRSRCCVLDASSQQLWSYELPAYVLRARRPLPPPGGGLVLAVTPEGLMVRHDEGEDGLLLAWTANEQSWDFELPGAAGEHLGPVVASQRWIAAATFDGHGAHVRLRDTGTGAVRAEMSLAAARHVALRLQDELLVAADDRGRVLALDLDQGWLVRDLRI